MSAGLAFFALGQAFRDAITNPYTALAAVAIGGALVAAGTASLSSMASGSSGTYSGNSSGCRSVSVSGGSAGNVSANAQAIAVSITGEFTQRGTDMVATINETNKRNTYAG